MVVLGIDPGIAIVGYGVLNYTGNHFDVVDFGVIRTASDLSYPRRLEIVYNGVVELTEKYPLDAVAMEELFFSTNVKTAISVAQARGVIALAVQQKQKPLYEYTPLQVKQGVCGYGKADKRQVQEMVRILLKLPQIPKPDDAADALAVAISHCHTSRFQEIFRA